MGTLDQAVENHLANIEIRAGKMRAELRSALLAQGEKKHGELLAWAKEEWGLSHGDANAIVLFARKADETIGGDPLDGIYVGPKAALRTLHDALMAEIGSFGELEIAPKKGYLSLRRKKQFAMVGPASNTRIEVGINQKLLPGGERLLVQPAGGMCSHKVRLSELSEIDAELLGWLRSAYDASG